MDRKDMGSVPTVFNGLVNYVQRHYFYQYDAEADPSRYAHSTASPDLPPALAAASATIPTAPISVIILILGIVWLALLAIYRLFCSPLAGIPGPKIAAVSAWYELYWDCVRQGHYLFKIEQMHQKYGLFSLSIRPFFLILSLRPILFLCNMNSID